MTLDEAIQHCEEVAEDKECIAHSLTKDGWQERFDNLTREKETEYKNVRDEMANSCLECAKEHRQLAGWLKELKALREVCTSKAFDMAIKALEQKPCDCRSCKKWDECPCGKEGHENGTSISYSVGECRDYEQEDILDKIRAKIQYAQTYKMFKGEDTVYVKRDYVLAIIDKYKTERSDKDGVYSRDSLRNC